jgi:hypothetical protein
VQDDLVNVPELIGPPPKFHGTRDNPRKARRLSVCSRRSRSSVTPALGHKLRQRVHLATAGGGDTRNRTWRVWHHGDFIAEAVFGSKGARAAGTGRSTRRRHGRWRFRRRDVRRRVRPDVRARLRRTGEATACASWLTALLNKDLASRRLTCACLVGVRCARVVLPRQSRVERGVHQREPAVREADQHAAPVVRVRVRVTSPARSSRSRRAVVPPLLSIIDDASAPGESSYGAPTGAASRGRRTPAG